MPPGTLPAIPGRAKRILASKMTTQNLNGTHAPRLDLLDENELVEQCRREIPHRMEAFRELTARHESEVFETCFRLVGDKAVAEQIGEDAFQQAFHQIHRFRPGESHSSLRVWLFQIAYRLCELEMEWNPRRRGRHLASGDDPMAQALAILDWDERSWIVLRFVGCLQTREIAEIFEIDSIESKERIYWAISRFHQARESIAS